MNYLKSLLLLSICFSLACSQNEIRDIDNSDNDTFLADSLCWDKAIDRGFVSVEGETYWLKGSNEGNSDEDFNITHWMLDACALKFGLGREHFPALNAPQYIPFDKVENDYDDEDKFIIVEFQDGIKAFPYHLMIEHEVVNEIIDGQPVMIAYCVLADLGAVYSRTFCDSTLTFALSGYVYSDTAVWDAIDAFVLWDRETESLWWPLIDSAVSGLMKGEALQKYNGQWSIISYRELELISGRKWILKAGQQPPRDITISSYTSVCN